MAQKFNLKLDVIDHDGSAVPCNVERDLSPQQRATICWLALDLLIDGDAPKELVLNFVGAIRNYGSGLDRLFPEPSGIHDSPQNEVALERTATDLYSVKNFKAEYDSLLGNALAFETSNTFRTSEEKYTLYKICRWAARGGTRNHERRRMVLANLRHDMGIQRDHRTLLISSAIEHQINKVFLANVEKSLCPTVALAMKILYADDHQFTENERVALHRMMLILGVKPTQVKGLAEAFNTSVSTLVQQIDPADYEETLRVALEMAILDHVISPSERRIIDDVLAQMRLSSDQLERIRVKTELDTGVHLRFEQTISIDYGTFKKHKKSG